MANPTVIQPGDRYGRLAVVERGPDYYFPSGQKQPQWLCRCDCGTTKLIRSPDLRSGHAKSCGCLSREMSAERYFKDITGQQFGRLTVIEFVETVKRKTLWRCRCECGAVGVFQGARLQSGHTTSCGCYKVDTTRERATTHGHAGQDERHPLYATWTGMLSRCRNKNLWAYQYYGARGISVCERWQGINGFVNFLADMGDKPPTPEWWKSTRTYWTIDRIDNDGNYEPDNCRWADPSTQARNR